MVAACTTLVPLVDSSLHLPAVRVVNYLRIDLWPGPMYTSTRSLYSLKGTYFAAGKPGPGVLLLHQCNRQRKVWDDLAARLATAGFHVMTVDLRGYGDSSGTPVDKLSPEEIRVVFSEKMPTDVETAYQYLVSQPGVSRDAVAVGGASCGVNQSVHVAANHPVL